MASEQVHKVLVHRHVFDSERPFSPVLDGIFGGISQPDIALLFSVTMGQMTRHVADAGSYAPVTILIQEMPDDRTRIAYDTVASAIAPYHDGAASEVAERLDTEVLGLLRQVTGARPCP